MQYCRNYKSTNWANEHFGDFRRSRTLALLTTANVHGMPHASVNVSQSAQGCTKRHVATQAIAITENSKCTEWRARLLRLCGQLCLVGAHRSGARERWACCMQASHQMLVLVIKCRRVGTASCATNRMVAAFESI